jgi:hypothetical protein
MSTTRVRHRNPRSNRRKSVANHTHPIAAAYYAYKDVNEFRSVAYCGISSNDNTLLRGKI